MSLSFSVAFSSPPFNQASISGSSICSSVCLSSVCFSGLLGLTVVSSSTFSFESIITFSVDSVSCFTSSELIGSISINIRSLDCSIHGFQKKGDLCQLYVSLEWGFLLLLRSLSSSKVFMQVKNSEWYWCIECFSLSDQCIPSSIVIFCWLPSSIFFN